MSEIQNQLRNPIITGRPDFQVTPRPVANPQAQPPGKTFGELLQENLAKTEALTFSKHAQTRTQQRGIELSETDLDRLNEAVGRAGDKGLTDTLVFMNNTAFIVNVPSRVVVTVMAGDESEGSVFTNIDGAVIV